MTTDSTRKAVMWQDLAALLGLLVLLVVTVYCRPLSIIRIILSFVGLLFTPGYAVLAALFPDRYELEKAGRFGLSFSISVTVLILIGLILNYSPWGMNLEAILVGIFGFVVTWCIVAFWRRANLAPDVRFHIDSPFRLFNWGTTGRLGKPLSVVLTLSVVGVLGGLIYAATQTKVEESFTEFYVLGPNGVAKGYPTEVATGDLVNLVIGVVNHEHGDVRYRVERTGDAGTERIANPQLSHEQTWEQLYTFALAESGENRKVTFLLYKEDNEKPYRSLHLWITVRKAQPTL